MATRRHSRAAVRSVAVRLRSLHRNGVSSRNAHSQSRTLETWGPKMRSLALRSSVPLGITMLFVAGCKEQREEMIDVGDHKLAIMRSGKGDPPWCLSAAVVIPESHRGAQSIQMSGSSLRWSLTRALGAVLPDRQRARARWWPSWNCMLCWKAHVANLPMSWSVIPLRLVCAGVRHHAFDAGRRPRVGRRHA